MDISDGVAAKGAAPRDPAANDRIGTTSVSVDVVETDPIVLRETERARLVFLPTLVEREERRSCLRERAGSVRRLCACQE